MSAIVAIPARLGSTRFPRKVLADIHGRPMLWHVYQGVSSARSISQVWVLSDSEEVLDAASSWGVRVLMTSPECPSGTARIASVLHKLDGDVIVNVQGDEPLISGNVIDRLVEALEEDIQTAVATPVYAMTDPQEITSPNVVKVARGSDGIALYFSRSPIPYVRDTEPSGWLSQAPFWGHAGVYAYRREVLMEYPRLPEGRLETAEKLEQLRLLEAGERILTVEIDYHPRGVDVPPDLELVKDILASSSRPS